MASRSTGGVPMTLRSRTPVSDIWSVRGIGVAESVNTWTSERISLSRSLWVTPKCCSSSMTSRPRSWNLTALASSAWVPMAMSTVPSVMPARVAFACLVETKRESCRTSMGNPRNRSSKLLAC